uniref:Peptidoglycan-binding LysM domain-containing family protein n=1 Tax=Rhizophora mucronata TaxID=61149 RepID=A0A2P2IMV7_RHIMU
MAFPSTNKTTRMSTAIADAASWYCAVILLGLILMGSVREISSGDQDESVRGSQLLDRPCDEIYVVGEGETLHTISDKCGDPFIVEQNPHIHDPDDVFPGLVIKITPAKPTRSSR